MACAAMANDLNCASGVTLDQPVERCPANHRMLDDMLDYTEHVRSRPVWRPMQTPVRAHFAVRAAHAGADRDVYDEFSRFVMPYTTGNVNPGFMGWVHGSERLRACLPRCSQRA